MDVLRVLYVRTASSQFVDEREASEVVPGAAEQMIVLALEERRVLLCSGRAAVSGCCQPGLHATQRCSSPGGTLSLIHI